jgi:hypothetical protein
VVIIVIIIKILLLTQMTTYGLIDSATCGYGDSIMADIKEAKRLVLTQYEQERDELDKIISKLRKDLGMSEDSRLSSDVLNSESESKPQAAVNVLQLIKPGDFFGMTQVQAAKTFLNHTNRQPVALQEIAAALYRGKATEVLIEGDALRNLSSLLSRSDDFISVAKGRWGLSEWYPNKAKKQRKTKDETKDVVPDEADGSSQATAPDSKPSQ